MGKLVKAKLETASLIPDVRKIIHRILKVRKWFELEDGLFSASFNGNINLSIAERLKDSLAAAFPDEPWAIQATYRAKGETKPMFFLLQNVSATTEPPAEVNPIRITIDAANYTVTVTE